MRTWQIKLSLFLNFFVCAILLNSVGIVILQVINNYQINEVSASILEACKDLTIAIVSFAVAAYLPKFGYRRSMLFALFLLMIACMAMPLLNNFLMTKLLFVAVGISFALIKVSVYSSVGIITDGEQQHASLMSLLEGIFQIGVLVGYWVFSFFVTQGNWLNTYWFLAGLIVIALLLLFTTKLDESKLHTDKTTSAIEDFVGMVSLIRLPLVIFFIFSIFDYVFIEQGIQSWLPTFNNKVLYLPEAISIQITSIFAFSIAFGRIVGGYVMKYLSWLYVIVGGLVCAAILMILILPMTHGIQPNSIHGWEDVPLAAFIFPMLGFFLAPIYPTLCSTVLSKLPKHQQSAMTGLIVIFSALGGTIGSRIVSILFADLGGQKAFYATLVPIAILIILIFPYNKLHKKFTRI